MIYLLTALSLTVNGILIWYIRKILKSYWFDVQAREKFTEMLENYSESLKSLYKLEELYGEEIIKKAIIQTKFVIEACNEFKESIDNQIEVGTGVYEEDSEEDQNQNNNKEKNVIVLREGEKVSQDAGSYKKIVLEN